MKIRNCALAASLALALVTNTLYAETITWVNVASGDWNVAANWNPATVPGSSDTAIIDQPGVTVTLTAATPAGSIVLGTNTGSPSVLELNNQTLTLDGSLTVNASGSFTLDSGVLAGGTSKSELFGAIGWTAGDLGGTLTLAPDCTLTITGGGGDNDMPSTTLTNNGTVEWVSGTIRGGGVPGTVIYNNGLWNCQSDQQINDAFGDDGTVFNNTGTFRKSGGSGELTGATLIAGGVFFNQIAGVIDVQEGTGTNGTELAFQGGANLNGGYITTNLHGLTVLSEGNFNLNGTITGTNTWEDAGNLTGTTVINGALTWKTGDWDAATSVTITPNSTLFIEGADGDNDMSSVQLTNNGAVEWVNGTIRGGGVPGTIIYNNGLWNCQSDQQINDAFGDDGTVFNNFGTFRKSGGGPEFTSATIIAGGVLFNQIAGVIDVQNGVGTNGLELAFQGGANLTGGYVTTNQYGLTVLSEGNFNINGTILSTNTWEDAGNLVGKNVIIGALVWIEGDWDDATSVTIAPNTTLFLEGGSGDLDMPSVQVTNYGTVAWLSGTVRGGGVPATVIYNQGLWNCQTDETFNNAFGDDGVVFNNTGMLRKSGGSNEFTTATIFSGIFMNQLAGGVIDVQNGIGTNGLQLAFQGGGNFTGGYITTNQYGLTTLELDSYIINGTVTGSNTWETDSGLLKGTNVIRGGLTWFTGNWDSATSVTIAPNTTLFLEGGTGDLDMPSVQVTNNGTVEWVSGTIRGGGVPATVIYNNGLWNALSDQTFNAAFGDDGVAFNNFGTFSKTGTSGSSTVLQAAFLNPGTLDTEVGNVNVQGAVTADHGTMHFGLTSTSTYGNDSVSTALTLNGTLGAGFLGGFTPAVGNTFTIITSSSTESGPFQNLNLPTLPAGDAWQVNYNASTVVLQVVALGTANDEITGSVKDSPTHGVAGATVFAFTGVSPNVYVSTTTDANGNYTLNVTNATWTVGLSNITALGYNPPPDQLTTTSAGTPDQVVNFYVQVTGATAPSATTTTPSSLTSSGATLNGTVNPDGEAVTVFFEYGTTSLNQFTVSNTISAALTTAQPVAIPIAGLAPNTQYQFEIVAENSIHTNFGGVVLFTTLGVAPVAVTTPATDIDSTNATVNGTVNPGGLATIYFFEFGTNTSYGNYSSTNDLVAGTTTVVVANLLTNLQPGTVYHYQLIASNVVGTNIGGDLTFTNLSAPPTALTLPATALSSSGATLNGSVNPNGLATLWYFQYGLTTNYGSVTPGATTAATNVFLAVNNILSTLNAGTPYHFQLVASNSLGTNLGGDLTFTTSGTGASSPSATTTVQTGLTSSGATLNGTVNPNGEATSVTFEYGTTSLSQSTTPIDLTTGLNTSQPIAVPIAGLAPATVYQFEIVAQNGVGTTSGGVLNFTTLGVAPAVVTTPATDIDSTNATVNGTVNPGGLATIYYFEFGTNTSYGNYTPTNLLPAGDTVLVVTNLLTNLQPGTVYHFQLVGSNSIGTNIGGDLTFTNLSAPPTALTLPATAVSSSGATLNGSVNPNGLPTLWYFQYGLTTSYGSVTPGSTTAATNVFLAVNNILSTLNAGTPYHFQLVASNSLGTNLGGDVTFTTSGTGASSPSATTTVQTGLTSSGATLNGTVNPNGEATSVTFEYGTTSLSQSTTPIDLTTGLNTSQPIAVPITGLAPATAYQFEIVAQNGVGTTSGGVLNFTTPGIAPAVVTTPATDIDSTNATVNGTVNPGGLATIYYFEFGTNTSYGNYSPTNLLPAGDTVLVVANLLTNLQPGTVYHYQLVGSNTIGTNIGGDLTFTNLPAPPTVLTLAASAVTTDGATLNGSVNPNGLPTLWYFQYGLTTNYGSVTPGTTTAPTNVFLAVSSILSTLNVGTPYHFELVGSNSLGTNVGGDLTFTTGTEAAMVTCPPDITINQATGECGQTVGFDPSVSGSPTPTLTSVLNGNVITSPFFFPVGTNVVTCTASNVAGTNSCQFTVVVLEDNPPVAGPNSLGTYEGVPASVAVEKVLIFDSSPTGATLSIPSVTPTTPNGATVSLAGGLITYTPTISFIGVDYITYALSDGCGIVPGTITVTVLSSNLPAKNEISISQNATGTTVVFAGVPGANYNVQSSSAMTGPWTTFSGGPIPAGANGLIQYTDLTAPAPVARFYRTQYVSGP